MRFPKIIEIHAKTKDVIKRIILAELLIDVFLIPYVIPIPKESILTERANTIIKKNIEKPPFKHKKSLLYIICKLKNKSEK